MSLLCLILFYFYFSVILFLSDFILHKIMYFGFSLLCGTVDVLSHDIKVLFFFLFFATTSLLFCHHVCAYQMWMWTWNNQIVSDIFYSYSNPCRAGLFSRQNSQSWATRHKLGIFNWTRWNWRGIHLLVSLSWIFKSGKTIVNIVKIYSPDLSRIYCAITR